MVEYEGTRYAGFQFQVGQPTVQGELEQGLARFTGESIRIRAASRTDSGAHAMGQVVDFPTLSLHPVEYFPRALNYYLPPDINVQAACEVDGQFNSRRNAVSRTYQYRILNRSWPSPLRRNFCFWVREWLDVPRMMEAAQNLVGCHDFRPLAAGLPAYKSGVRTVVRWDVWREADTVIVECEGNGFLRHQIRRANALLVEIGKGRLPGSMVSEVLTGSSGETARWPSVPARGLRLMKVNYPDLCFRTDTPGAFSPPAMVEQQDFSEAPLETY